MTQPTTMHQIQTSPLVAARIKELYKDSVFSPFVMGQLGIIAENERAKLQASCDEKLRMRLAKLISRKTVGKLVGEEPDDASSASSAASDGGAQ